MLYRLLRPLAALAAAAVIWSLGITPTSAVLPEEEEKPAPTAPKPGDKKKASQQKLPAGYRAARSLVDKGAYEAGIAALRGLGADNHPDVANAIGFASRKLGRYDEAKLWYERALAADSKHVRTWSYYGMWHVERGDLRKAAEFLETVRSICGTDCREYRELKEVIDGTREY